MEPVPFYNSSTWGLIANDELKSDNLHREQLGQRLVKDTSRKYEMPNDMKNANAYDMNKPRNIWTDMTKLGTYLKIRSKYTLAE